MYDHLNLESLKDLNKLTILDIDFLNEDFNENILKYLKNLKVLRLKEIGKMSTDLVNDIDGLSNLEELVIVPFKS